MSDPVGLLEKSTADVLGSDGAACIRALVRFDALLKNNRAIRKAVRRCEERAKKAEEKYLKFDSTLVRELVVYRDRLIRRAPETDDRDLKRMGAHGSSAEGRAFAGSLANFDQILEDGPDQIVNRDGLDVAESRTLADILWRKIDELRFPDQYGHVTPVERGVDQRPDLQELAEAVEDVRGRQRARFRELEAIFEQTGYPAMVALRGIVESSRLEYRTANSTAEKAELLNRRFLEVSAGHHVLQKAVRPPESGVVFDETDQRYLDYYVREIKRRVPRLQAAIQAALEESGKLAWWSRLNSEAKIGLVGVFLTAIGIVVAVIIA